MKLPYFLRKNEKATPVLNIPTNDQVFYRGERVVKGNCMQYQFKRFFNTHLSKFNGIKLYLFETSKGVFYAQTRGGYYTFKLERITDKHGYDYLNYWRAKK